MKNVKIFPFELLKKHSEAVKKVIAKGYDPKTLKPLTDKENEN